ncbi:MAG: NADPH-dependent oxidoreductase [Balneolaceae bacterium]|nr:MAG: NADPH-dependent oxidoreductase [Balneolaceae bacterium]
MRIHILSATDRPGSNAKKVSRYASEVLKEDAAVSVFSLEDYPLEDVKGGKYGQEIDSVNSFNQAFLEADGYLFVIPEYNGGFPGILKLFYDYLPFPQSFSHKPVSLIGEAAGNFGALRSVEQFEQLLKYRKAYIYPERMFIQRVNDNFDMNSGLKNESLQKLLLGQLRGFPGFVRKLNQN